MIWYILAYVIAVGCLVAAITHAWWGSGTKAEQERAALQEVNKY